MPAIPALVVLLIGLALPFPALLFGYRFFTHTDYASCQSKSLQFLVLAGFLSTVFAVLNTAHEYIAQARLDPMGIFPIEHGHSLERTALNMGVAVLSCLVTWFYAKSNRPLAALPRLSLILILAILATFASLASIYVSTLGFCCESPYAIFAGFPFSLASGLFGFDHNLFWQFRSMSLFQILSADRDHITWYPRLIPLLLDLLFWINAANILFFIGYFAWFRKKVSYYSHAGLKPPRYEDQAR